MDRQDQHQDEQGHHQVFRHPLQAALEVEAQHQEAQDHGDQQIDHVDAAVGDHAHEAQVGALADEELHEVVDHPAGDHAVEGHESHVAQQGQVAVDMPFLAGLLQLLIHPHGAGLGGAAHGKFHHHGRKAQQDQTENVDQDESAPAELPGHPGEFPDVAAADGAAGAQQDEAQAAAQSFALVIHFSNPRSFLHLFKACFEGIIKPFLKIL